MSVCFSPDGTTVACATSGSPPSLTLHDAQSGQQLCRLDGHSDHVSYEWQSIDWLSDSNVCYDPFLSRDCVIQIMSVSFSPDGCLLASCSSDKTIKVWDVKKQSLIRTFEGHTEWVSGSLLWWWCIDYGMFHIIMFGSYPLIAIDVECSNG